MAHHTTHWWSPVKVAHHTIHWRSPVKVAHPTIHLRSPDLYKVIRFYLNMNTLCDKFVSRKFKHLEFKKNQFLIKDLKHHIMYYLKT